MFVWTVQVFAKSVTLSLYLPFLEAWHIWNIAVSFLPALIAL